MSFQHYYLHYQSKILDPLTDKNLSDYGIGKESTIEIHFRNGTPLYIKK